MTKELTPKDSIINDFNALFPLQTDESNILVGCRSIDYCASHIAHAVEDCNAAVLNLNVTTMPCSEGELAVLLRVNHRNPESICRSLARYGYLVLGTESYSSTDTDAMRDRANEVLRMLNV